MLVINLECHNMIGSSSSYLSLIVIRFGIPAENGKYDANFRDKDISTLDGLLLHTHLEGCA